MAIAAAANAHGTSDSGSAVVIARTHETGRVLPRRETKYTTPAAAAGSTAAATGVQVESSTPIVIETAPANKTEKNVMTVMVTPPSQ